jgi:excisionase family DNA binding protein
MSSLTDGTECTHSGCDMVTVKQAALELAVNMQTVYRWIWAGKMPVIRRGHKILIKASWLRDFKSGAIVWEHGNKKEVPR